MNKCEKCGGIHWRTAPCVALKKSPQAGDGLALDQVARESGLGKKSTGLNPKPGAVGIKVTGAQKASLTSEPVDAKAGENDGGREDRLSCDLSSPISPAPKFDKAAWMRANMPKYMQRYRAEVKAGIRVPQPRVKK